jgi:hypothetical protein
MSIVLPGAKNSQQSLHLLQLARAGMVAMEAIA